MIYQLRDDILDLTATKNQLGKPAGQDLAEGIYNLPTLYAINDRRMGDELRQLLGQPLDEDDRERARKIVVATDGIEQTILAATRYLDLAHEALSVVPSAGLRVGFSSLITSLLEDLPGY
jgi:heptaprenyl diphosphate synthase